MTRSEVVELVDLIQIHRPYFKTRLGEKIYQNLVIEWSRIMEPYDYEDIKKNLEDFLKDENNYGKEPDAYQLIRGLLTTEDKKEGNKGQVACQFCGRFMSRLDIGSHEDRCRSIRYLKKLYDRYLNATFNISKELYEMNDKEFEQKYIAVLEKALPRVNDVTEKRGMTNVIETYYGRDPIYTVGDLWG